jgi:hypothetical protein
LALLEGIDEKLAEKEIRDERAYILPKYVDKHIGLDQISAAQPVIYAEHDEILPVSDLDSGKQSGDPYVNEKGEIEIDLHLH